MTLKEKILLEHYTEDDVAEVMGITVSRLRARRTEGRDHPPAVKIGRTVYFRKTDTDAWLKKRPVQREIA